MAHVVDVERLEHAMAVLETISEDHGAVINSLELLIADHQVCVGSIIKLMPEFVARERVLLSLASVV